MYADDAAACAAVLLYAVTSPLYWQLSAAATPLAATRLLRRTLADSLHTKTPSRTLFTANAPDATLSTPSSSATLYCTLDHLATSMVHDLDDRITDAAFQPYQQRLHSLDGSSAATVGASQTLLTWTAYRAAVSRTLLITCLLCHLRTFRHVDHMHFAFAHTGAYRLPAANALPLYIHRLKTGTPVTAALPDMRAPAGPPSACLGSGRAKRWTAAGSPLDTCHMRQHAGP